MTAARRLHSIRQQPNVPVAFEPASQWAADFFMSQQPDTELDLELQLLPAWAKQNTDTNRFANYRGDEESGGGARRGRGDRSFGDRPPRRDGPGGGPRRDGPGGPRPGGPRRDGPGGPRRDGPRSGPGRGPRDRDDRRDEPRREAPAPLPDFDVNLMPEEKGVEGLARQIKLTGRAYPIFDIAHLILKKPDRFTITYSVIKTGETVAAPLFLCTLDETLWLSEAEVTGHLLNRHFNTFYSTEKIAGDAPKGTYTFVAQCGMSGIILGPPNYHDYQTKLHKLHTERFSRMPFDMFKSRVKIVRDEAVVKQWVEESSFKTEFTALNIPEPVKFNTRAEVEAHFKATHLPNLFKSVASHTLLGVNIGQSSPVLRRIFNLVVEDQVRFPLKLVNILCTQFSRLGLQFFKVNKTITHVSVARPTYLDMAVTPVSPNLRRLIECIDATPKCTRRKLIETLAPGPTIIAIPAPVEGQPAAAPTTPEATAEQSAINSDLHWLVHQGHVIEFANGLIETAKKPLPRPAPQPRPEGGPKPERAPRAERRYLPVFFSVPLLAGV